ncbi:MAG: conjugal transfer protein TraD [Nitrospira sp.]
MSGKGKVLLKPLEKLQEKKQKLEARISLIKARERRLERKRRTRNLIQIGGLAEIAGLQDVDKGVLLGALLEIAKISKNKVIVKKWKAEGDRLLKNRGKARDEKKRTSR